MSSGELRNHWTLFWWVLGTLTIPITVPYLILQYLSKRRPKLSLPGKVSVPDTSNLIRRLGAESI